MTLILGWRDGPDAFLCGDSVVTGTGPARAPSSSFGETHKLDQVTVEEAAIKILELPRGTLVGVCGDPLAALGCLSLVAKDLDATNKPLRTILRELQPVFKSTDASFELLFAHESEQGSELTAFGSSKSMGTDFGDRVVVLGSLPAAKQKAASDLLWAIRAHGMFPEERLAASLVLLQGTGITDYLLDHGVGGAFFGAWRSTSGARWQPDLNYFVYPPGVFVQSPVILREELMEVALPPIVGLEKVRVLIRQGAGIVLSSMVNPLGRIFIPPNSKNSDAEWRDIVLAATPPPFPLVVRSRHYGFLSKGSRKAAYISRRVENDDGLVRVATVQGKVHLMLDQQFVKTLESPTQEGCFDFTIAIEDVDGAEVKTYRLTAPRAD